MYSCVSKGGVRKCYIYKLIKLVKYWCAFSGFVYCTLLIKLNTFRLWWFPIFVRIFQLRQLLASQNFVTVNSLFGLGKSLRVSNRIPSQ